jgi:hypothetical protein
MKQLSLSLSILFGLSFLFATSGCTDQSSPEAILKNVDAVQAMAIANEWNWSKKEIKSYVTARDVVFEFSKSKVKRIPLPEDKMLVAVAPYINQTHK